MPHTLLLADDSTTIQRLVELTFANEDIRVIAVGDGNHAVATLAHSRPDIVLADVGMPGRNGYDLARHIKQSPELTHVPVLLLTGAFEPIDQARAADVGCDGVISKPFDPRAVVARVKELLQRRDEALAAARASEAVVPEPAMPVAAAMSHGASTRADTDGPAAASPLDDYFEQLDQAITARVNGPAGAHPPVAAHQGALLAGAFSALLAAEQSGAAPEAFAEWLPEEPEPPPPAPEPQVAAPAVITDATIDLIVQRVLERLSDRVVRDTVANIASTTAERLVREEIERIKSHIK